MQRVTRSTNAASLPAIPGSPSTPGYFTEGNPSTSTPATIPGYEWFNAIQEELIATIAAGLVTPNANTLNQTIQSLKRLFGGNIRTVTTSTVLAADDAGLVLVNATAASVVVTLPQASTCPATSRIWVARTDSAGSHTVTVQPHAGDTIVGAVPIDVGESAQMICDGTSTWRVLSVPAASSPGIGLYLGTATGSANALVFTPGAPISSYGVGVPEYVGKAAYNNTGPATINISGVGVVNLVADTPSGLAPLTGGEIHVGDLLTMRYDGTSMQITARGALPVASNTVQGVIRIATVNETKAGADNTTAVSPADLAAELAAGVIVWLGAAGGSANALTFSPTVPVTAYGTGVPEYVGEITTTNTGPATINISGVGVVAIEAPGSSAPAALAGGEMVAGELVGFRFDGTVMQISSDFRVALATHTIPGVAALATIGEAIAGTDDQKIMTPKDVAAVIASDGGPPKLKFHKFTSSGTFTTPSTSSNSTVYKVTAIGAGGGSDWNQAGDSVIAWINGIDPSTALTVTIGQLGPSGGGHIADFHTALANGATNLVRAVSNNKNYTDGASVASIGDIIIHPNDVGGSSPGLLYTNTLLGFSGWAGSSVSVASGGYGYGDTNGGGGPGFMLIEWIG